MKIASFNVENLGGGDETAERHAVLRPQLTRLSADILCLQEVDAQSDAGKGPRSYEALNALLLGTGYETYHRVTTSKSDGSGPRDRHNLVILSRWPAETSAQYSNDLLPPPRYRPVTAEPQDSPEIREDVAWDRPILHATFGMADGRKLHIVNMHLKAPLASFVPGQKIGRFAWKSVAGWAEGYYLAAMKRAGQALEARLLVDRIFAAQPEALLAVCGDFNAEERDVAFHILAGDTEDTGNGALAAHELIALENTLPESQRYTVIHGGRRMMLDHIMVSRSLLGHYRGIEIHNETLGDELVDYSTVQNTPESYHAPVVATFNFAS